MKTPFLALIAVILAGAAQSQAQPAKRVTNTEHNDGTGSSKEIDPSNRTSTETFFDGAQRPRYKIVYTMDDRMIPQSGIYYNNAGKIFQKSKYTHDGADRMVQEIVYDAKDQLVCTKNYIWGTRFGQPMLVEVQVYDRNGQLTKSQKRGSQYKPRR